MAFSSYQLRDLRQRLLADEEKREAAGSSNDRTIAVFVIVRLCEQVEEYLEVFAPVTIDLHNHVERTAVAPLQRLSARLLSGETVKSEELVAAIRAVRSLQAQ